MSISWIRDEVLKEEKDIDWISIINYAKKAHSEKSKNESVIGITKGYINFVKVSYEHYAKIVKDDLQQIDPDLKIYIASTQSQVIKLIKSKVFTFDEIKNDKIILISDKSTIETALRRYDISYIKFTFKETRSSNKRVYIWKKEGKDKGIKWEKDVLLSLKRENILNQLFN
jgi:hypothetical protein